MAVTHGSIANVYFDGYDFGVFTNQVKAQHTMGTQDSTTLNNPVNKSYATLLKDGTATLSGFYDEVTVDGVIVTDDHDMGDYVLDGALNNQNPATPDDLMYFPGGAVNLGDRGIGLEGILNDYEINTDPSSLGAYTAQIQGCTGREVLSLLLPLTSRTNAVTGTGLNNVASTSFGGSGWVQCTSFTSGSLPVLIEHSADNTAWSTLVTFTAITAKHKFQRIALAPGTLVKQYLRASANGTYVASFIAAFNRKTVQ